MNNLEKTKYLLSKYNSKRLRLPVWLSIVLILFLSFGICWLNFHVGPEPFETIFAKKLAGYPALLYLNWLPIALLMTFIWLITNNSVLGVLLGGGIPAILAIANSIKIVMRQDPLLPTDLTLIREALMVFTTFPPATKRNIYLVIAILIIAIIAAAVVFTGKKISLKYRLLSIVLTVAIALFANTFYYSSTIFYNRFPVEGNTYFPVNHYNSKGFLYSFLQNVNTMEIQKPIGYMASKYKDLESTPSNTAIASEKKPHIIMIMSEAYSDLSENEHLDFTHYVDPMENYKELTQKDGAISGHIVVPNFGGGTSNTEYDVLTACPTRYLDNSLPSYNFVRYNFDALPRRLETIGYQTLAIHPGYYWFYNRHNVYQSFGFDNFIHLSSYDTSGQSKGGYITEKATTDTIINTLDEHIANSDNPLFSFSVTIQNHGPYEQKYAEAKKTFDTDVELTDLEYDMLDNYFYGMIDVDREIGRLVDYMQNSDEPIVFVYFGDHMPGFSNGMDFFDILDYDIDIEGDIQEQLGVYQTPYVIWQNDSAKAITALDNNTKAAKLPDQNVISSNYLGSLLMELLDYNGLSPLYDYSNELRKELPIMSENGYLNGNGEYTKEINEELVDKINFLKGWQYYKLFDQKISN